MYENNNYNTNKKVLTYLSFKSSGSKLGCNLLSIVEWRFVTGILCIQWKVLDGKVTGFVCCYFVSATDI